MVRIKRYLSAAISIVLVITLLGGNFAYANELDQQQLECNDKEECLKAINSIEAELKSEGTTVEKELLSFYTNLEIDRQALKINSTNSYDPVLINGSNDIIESIEVIHNTDNIRSTSLEIYYLGLAGTIIAWFNSKGYKLSAELLDHAANNSTLNSYYYPTYGSRVKSSSVYWNKKNSSGSSGDGVFPNTGSTKEKDLYYAIHKFNWYRHAGQFIISDLYDFANDKAYWKTISGVAVHLMYNAQNLGVLTPYYTRIYS